VGYIAPEQISSRNVTAAADVYSAGVVLYEMLTGRVPELGRLGERSLGPVSEVVNAEANVMPALNLASRCLELAPTRRPTIAQLLADLDALNQRDATRPPGRASTLRRKVLTIATAATIAAATAVFTRSRAATPESARPGPKLVVERTAAVEAELVQPAPGIERNVVPSPLAPPVARPARRRTPAAPRPLPTSAPNNAGAHVTNHPAQRPDEIVRAFDPADRPVRDLVDPFTND
jgi:serine/threonine-protein kinase